MSTHQQPRSDKFLEQPNTGQLQEANTSETTSLDLKFVAMKSVVSDGKAMIEIYEINHDLCEINLIK